LAEIINVQPERGRFQLPNGSIIITALLEFAGMGLAVFVFGMDLWIPIQILLVVSAIIFRGGTGAIILIAMNLLLGVDFAIFIFGFPSWPGGLVGMLAILMIATHFFSKQGEQLQGKDQNPIVYLILIILTRAWAVLYFATGSQFTEANATSSEFTWITVFVFGSLPDLPALFNIIFIVLLNGTLLLYLILLLKRIANPVAN